MRCLLLSVIALLSVMSASAQPGPGTFSIIPRLGVALSNIAHESLSISANTTGTYYSLDSKYREGAMGGVDVQYQASNIFAISAGLTYSRMGCKYEDSDITGFEPGTYAAFSNSRLSLDYLSLPVLVHAYIAHGFSVNAGVQVAYRTRSNLHTESTDVTINKDGSYTYGDVPQKDDEDYVFAKRFDFSIPVGVSYEYANVVLDLRYNIGVSKVFDWAGSGENRSLAFTVGYKLDL